MCGIVAVLRQPSRPDVADPDELHARLATVLADLQATRQRLPRSRADEVVTELAGATERIAGVDARLRGPAGVACLLAGPGLAVVERLAAVLDRVGDLVAAMEADLDEGRVAVGPEAVEALSSALLGLKDAWWAVRCDRLGMATSVAGLVPEGLAVGAHTPAALDGLWSIQVALSSLDRLEVRGRDSAGLHVLVAGHGLDLHGETVQRLLGARTGDRLFTSLAVRTPDGLLSMVYKAAAEIGELGDNVRALRLAIRSDPLLALALGQPEARTVVLGHTRWASVGIISQANAHPLNSDEGTGAGPYVTAALNGDIDNYGDLRLSEALLLPAEMTTDAKVIPTLVSRRLSDGVDMDEAFMSAVARFDGSVAIAASAAANPDEIHLALRGSGQSLYIGLADGAFVVASEPYGLVEETTRYVRMDGEATQGQTVVLRRDGAGTVGAMRRSRYSGTPLPLTAADVVSAAITTRDIDRAGFAHFLLKEISEAPLSFHKTLRGRVATAEDGLLEARLGDDTIPPGLRRALAAGTVRRILVIGQGTAAVAGQAVATAVHRVVPHIPVSALPATELSGFGLSDDMGDTLVIAISQSGTTTDTNRTVDLVRHRGAWVVGVVNRRNSDLAAKAHGVLYTSDGRDVEMSVASTKAFYAQVAAGWLLAVVVADITGTTDRAVANHLLRSLRELPDAMSHVLGNRAEIARIAQEQAPSRRYWALVGNGPDRVAASELRIKLSELCYKSIACDATEDKKHIDLSSEPLIIVCAGGLSGPIADDVAKEVAIYRAHKAAPIVIANAAESSRFAAALEVIEVPAVDPDMAFVLSAMVGHLFGYEAALAIDAQARPLRQARAAIEAVASGADHADGDGLLDRLGPPVALAVAPFLRGLRDGSYNGHLEAGTAVRLVSLLRYASGGLPIEGYELEFGQVGTPGAVLNDLVDALTAGIDELTRPVDAIKHQAKTVTVGISRREDELLTVALVTETLSAGAAPDQLGYRALRALAALDPAVVEVRGFTRYRIYGTEVEPLIEVVDRGGLGRTLRSRTAGNPRLRGSKHRAFDEREVTVARGRSDGRTVVFVPEVTANAVTGLTLLHVSFADRLPAAAAKAVLSGYRGRYSALADAVTETEATFDDSRLGDVPIAELLTEPVLKLAEHWRHGPAI